jgi:hypothetical protein
MSDDKFESELEKKIKKINRFAKDLNKMGMLPLQEIDAQISIAESAARWGYKYALTTGVVAELVEALKEIGHPTKDTQSLYACRDTARVALETYEALVKKLGE